jgi:hypothetical protein
MLKSLTISLFCCFLAIAASKDASAQAVVADSASLQQIAYNHITDNFYTAIGAEARIYTGKEYNGYNRNFIGNPYLMDIDEWHTGTIIYDGYTYKNMDLRYDVYADAVIILLYKSSLRISLPSENVESFDVFDRHFIHIKNNPAVSNSVKTGFYDEMYGGKIKVLARRMKDLQQQTDINGGIRSYFRPTVDYYALKNGEYYTVNSKGAFLDLFKDKKKQIQQFIKTNGIKFKKATQEQAMVKIAAYYDQITD